MNVKITAGDFCHVIYKVSVTMDFNRRIKLSARWASVKKQAQWHPIAIEGGIPVGAVLTPDALTHMLAPLPGGWRMPAAGPAGAPVEEDDDKFSTQLMELLELPKDINKDEVDAYLKKAYGRTWDSYVAQWRKMIQEAALQAWSFRYMARNPVHYVRGLRNIYNRVYDRIASTRNRILGQLSAAKKEWWDPRFIKGVPIEKVSEDLIEAHLTEGEKERFREYLKGGADKRTAALKAIADISQKHALNIPPEKLFTIGGREKLYRFMKSLQAYGARGVLGAGRTGNWWEGVWGQGEPVTLDSLRKTLSPQALALFEERLAEQAVAPDVNEIERFRRALANTLQSLGIDDKGILDTKNLYEFKHLPEFMNVLYRLANE